MSRSFATVFRRIQAGPWAGDSAPAGGQVVNNPTTGVGIMFRIPLQTLDLSMLSIKFQGYFTSTTGGLTADLQLWMAAGDGSAAGDWIQVGEPLLAVAQSRLFVTAGVVEDSDVVIQVTPSAALAGAGDTLTMYLEQIGD